MRIVVGKLNFFFLFICIAAFTGFTPPVHAQGDKGQSLDSRESGQTSYESKKSAEQDCSASADQCGKPVCWAGDQGDCSCFTCEYGKPHQHVVCTKNKNDKNALYAFVERSPNSCPALVGRAPAKPSAKD